MSAACSRPGVLRRLAVAAVGEALAGLVGVGELALLAPGAAVDQLVDVRAVGALGVGEHPQARRLDVDAHPLGIVQRVGADEVVREGLVGGGGAEGGFGEELGLQRQQVAEDAREGHHHVDARAAEDGERHEVGAGQPAVGVEAGRRADQRHRLGDRAAVGLDAVRAPEHQRHRVRQARRGRRAAAGSGGHRPAWRRRWACGRGRRRGCCARWAGCRGCGSGRRPAPAG